MAELRLPKRLTLAEASTAARSLAAEASAAVADTMPLVINASGMEGFDSSAFAVMLEVVRKAKSAGRDVTVRGAPASMVELAKLYGVDELLSFSA